MKPYILHPEASETNPVLKLNDKGLCSVKLECSRKVASFTVSRRLLPSTVGEQSPNIWSLSGFITQRPPQNMCVYRYTCVFTYIYMYMCIYIYIYTYYKNLLHRHHIVDMCVCICICIYIYIYVYICTCIYIYTYIHTYTAAPPLNPRG